jgi:hypothetical protein
MNTKGDNSRSEFDVMNTKGDNSRSEFAPRAARFAPSAARFAGRRAEGTSISYTY